MNFKKVVRIFKDNSVCVVGLRGKGKDVLFGNVIARRRIPYCSNTYYAPGLIPFRYKDIAVAGNTYKDFISGSLKKYRFPYPDGTDLYLSDAGVYFPSQYCSELNKLFPNMSVYQALSRHLGLSNMHINVQNLNRCWDKIREMSDTYIQCNSCFVLKKIPVLGLLPLIRNLVVQKITVYDKYQSCVDRVKPFRVRRPLFPFGKRYQDWCIEHDRFEQQYGSVKSHWLIYRNRSNHDTRLFKSMLEEGEIDEKEEKAYKESLVR